MFLDHLADSVVHEEKEGERKGRKEGRIGVDVWWRAEGRENELSEEGGNACA